MADDTILLKKSGLAGDIPLPSQLELGELALNYADGRLYAKRLSGQVKEIGFFPSSNNVVYVSVEGDDANDGLDPTLPKRTIRAAINAIEKSNTISIGPGVFVEKTPLILPQNVTLHGVDQRITTVKAEDPTKDIIWVSTACYVTGFAFRDHLAPSAAISFPGNVEIGTAQSAGDGANTIVLDSSVAVTGVGMDNYYREMRITLTAGTGLGQSRNIVTYNANTLTLAVDTNWTVPPDNTSDYLIDIEIPTAPAPDRRYSAYITASPYLYNLACVSKSVGANAAGDGMVVDGFLAAGLKSMVSAQFTQYNQGGRGVIIRNMGYAQLVSIYGICCDDAFVAESGGTSSMGNCNVNFGNRGLVANGVGPLLLTTDAGFTYNEAKCRRDTGLIVDSLALDILMSSNTQSVFAGIQYWNQDTANTLPETQLTPTIGTFEYLQTLSNNVIRGDATGVRYQAVVSQITTNPATTTESAIVEEDFQWIIDILNNGTTGITDNIVPNGIVATSNANKLKAYTLLQSNKTYMQKEATAYLTTTYPDSIRQISSTPTVTGTGPFYVTYSFTSMNVAPTVGSTYTVAGNATDAFNGDFVVVSSSNTTANLQSAANPGTWGSGTTYLTSYNQATCERDVGYIIDCLSFDLKYTGNKQAIQAGVYYYGYSDVSAIIDETVQTVEAYNLIKSLAAYVIANTAVPETYQVANTQVFSANPGTANESAYANSNINLITNIIQNGPNVAPPLRPIELTANANAATAYAASLLINNRAFIQDEVVSYINTNYAYDNQTGFNIRVSTVVPNLDSRINIESNTKPYVGLVAHIDGETTLDIQLGPGYAVGNTINISSYDTDTAFTNYMIGTVTAWDPVAESATVEITSAQGVGNTRQLWTTNLISYNREKCERDIGLIVDSLVQDVYFTGNTQSTFAGLQYWNQSQYAVPTEEVLATLGALEQIKTEIASAFAGTATTTNTLMNVIINIFNGTTDPTTITDAIVINDSTANGGSIATGYAAIQAAKSTIQSNVISWVNTNYPGLLTVGQQTKCSRDVGYIIDSICYDLLYNGNRQSIQSGIYYLGYSGTESAVPNEISQVTSAYNYLKTILPHIIEGIPLSSPYQNTYTQDTTGLHGTITQSNLAKASVTTILDIINNGPAAYLAEGVRTPIGLVASSGAASYAYNKLKANRDFIAEEVVAYIDTQSPTAFDHVKCKRDLKLIVDAIAQDIKFPGISGNSQTVFAGLQYWEQATNVLPANQIANTLIALTAAKNEALTYILTVPEQTRISDEFDIIIDLINGTTDPDTITDFIIPNGITANTNVNIVAARNALQGNIAAIKTAATDAISPALPAPTITKCQRDVGYIVDSICNDLIYGGNKQAVQSGIYYFGYTGTTQVPGEYEKVVRAYQYIKEISYYIIQGLDVPDKIQTDVAQDTATAAGVGTSSLAVEVGKNIDLITNIIGDYNLGTNLAPLPLSPSGVAARRYAAEQLYYNKPFITAEVLSYLDRIGVLGRFTQEFTVAASGTLEISTIDTSLVIPKYRTVLAVDTVGDITNIELDERIITPIPRGKKIRFYQKSTLSASGQTFEFVGSGVDVNSALPRLGGDIVQSNEVVSSNGGIVYFTSTDQFGNFRIGEDLVINFNTGTLSGRTFTKSLYAQITPFVLALSND